MNEIYKYDYKQYQLLVLLFYLKFLIDLEICFEFGTIIEFLLNFFSYFNKALSPFFFTSLIIFVTDTELERIFFFY